MNNASRPQSNLAQIIVAIIAVLSFLYNIDNSNGDSSTNVTPIDTITTIETKRTEPERTEPERTEPERTEPERTEPERTEPERTEPKLQKYIDINQSNYIINYIIVDGEKFEPLGEIIFYPSKSKSIIAVDSKGMKHKLK